MLVWSTLNPVELLPTLSRGLRHVLVLRGVSSAFIGIEGHPVHYYELRGPGRGPPIVLVHGLGGSANGFYKVLHPLAQQFSRVIVPDLPGNGFSPCPGDGLGTYAQLEILVGFLEQVVAAPAFVVGNSLGGAMTITLASRRPDLVRGLGLVAPAGARVAEARLEALFKSLRITTRAEAKELTHRLFHKAPIGALLLASDLRRVYSTTAVNAILREQRPTDFLEPEVLEKLHMPTLLIWGESEKLLPFEGIHYFREHMPKHAEVHIVPGFGHVPQMEHPRELVRHLVSFAGRSGLVESI